MSVVVELTGTTARGVFTPLTTSYTTTVVVETAPVAFRPPTFTPVWPTSTAGPTEPRLMQLMVGVGGAVPVPLVPVPRLTLTTFTGEQSVAMRVVVLKPAAVTVFL